MFCYYLLRTCDYLMQLCRHYVNVIRYVKCFQFCLFQNFLVTHFYFLRSSSNSKDDLWKLVGVKTTSSITAFYPFSIFHYVFLFLFISNVLYLSLFTPSFFHLILLFSISTTSFLLSVFPSRCNMNAETSIP